MKPALRTLILASIGVPLLGLTAFWSAHAYGSLRDLILAGFDRKLLTLGGVAASFVDADAHRAYQQPPGAATPADVAPDHFDTRDPFYLGQRAAFHTLRADAGLTYLYTQVYVGDDRIYYVLDGDDDPSPPGTADTLLPESVDRVRAAWLGGKPYISDIQEWENWGLIKLASVPILDRSGATVAMAGADVDISVIRAKTRRALLAAIAIGAGGFALAAIVSLRVSRALVGTLLEIKNSALWIAAGYHDTRARSTSPREIGLLAAEINRLGARLQDQQTRALDYQDRIDRARRALALRHALAEAAHPGIPPDDVFVHDPESGDETSTEIDGSVWHAAGGLLWSGLAAADPPAAIRERAAIATLAREFLRPDAPLAPADALVHLFAAHPRLRTAALWDDGQRRLYWKTRDNAVLPASPAGSPLVGAGVLDLRPDQTLRWSAASAEAPPRVAWLALERSFPR